MLFAPRLHQTSTVRAKSKGTRSVRLDVAIFTLGSVDQLKSLENQKETRSVSEGFFDFSNKPTTRYATQTSTSRHPRKRNIQDRERGTLRIPDQANN